MSRLAPGLIKTHLLINKQVYLCWPLKINFMIFKIRTALNSTFICFKSCHFIFQLLLKKNTIHLLRNDNNYNILKIIIFLKIFLKHSCFYILGFLNYVCLHFNCLRINVFFRYFLSAFMLIQFSLKKLIMFLGPWQRAKI